MAAIGLILYLAFIVFIIAGVWKTYVKMGLPGWTCIVPIYSFYVLIKKADKPGWWLLLAMFVPFAIFYIGWVVLHDMSTKFGKGAGFTLGLIFLSFIFFPILGFGDAQYQGNVVNDGYDDILDDNTMEAL